MTIRRYLKQLAGRTPAPGGGSAAALVAAAASALLAMSAKYMLNRADTAGARKSISAASSCGERASRRLVSLMREDAKAYRRLAEEMKKRRSKKIFKLYKDAIGVPLEICAIAAQNASICAEICGHCRTSIMSDIAEAVILCEAAFFSARLNVMINLRSMEDEDRYYKNKVGRDLAAGERAIRKAKKAALEKARKFLR